MKENDLDLKALENADDETVRRIAGSYETVAKDDMKRLYDRSEKIFRDKSDIHSNEADVSGVEQYRRPVWHKALAFASALLLIVGVGSGGAYLLKNKGSRHETAESVSETTEISAAAESSSESEEVTATESLVEIFTESVLTDEGPSPGHMPLQLHEPPLHRSTLEEAQELVFEHSTQMSWPDRYGVDNDYYSGLFSKEGYDINSLEAKSYLYHIAMNSFLYFDTAKGTFREENTTDQTYSTEASFRVDLNAHESFASILNENTGKVFEEYIYDNKVYHTNPESKTYSTSYCSSQDTFSYTEDNYRNIDIDPPDFGLSVTGMFNDGGYAGGNLCAEPLVISNLVDFDKWQVNGMTEYLGRTAAEITGSLSTGNEFTMIVDINIGIVLDYTEYSAGKTADHLYFTELETDVPVDKVIFVKPEGYSAETLPFYDEQPTAGIIEHEIPDDDGIAHFLND